MRTARGWWPAASPPRCPAHEGGFFVEPTVFADVKSDMRIFQEEVFGPFTSVTPFKDEADALRLANDSPFGLAAAIRTRDVGARASRRVRRQGRHRLDQRPSPARSGFALGRRRRFRHRPRMRHRKLRRPFRHQERDGRDPRCSRSTGTATRRASARLELNANNSAAASGPPERPAAASTEQNDKRRIGNAHGHISQRRRPARPASDRSIPPPHHDADRHRHVLRRLRHLSRRHRARRHAEDRLLDAAAERACSSRRPSSA